MQQEAVALCAYLASRAQQPMGVPSASRDPLVELILKRCADSLPCVGECGLNGADTTASIAACLRAARCHVSDCKVGWYVRGLLEVRLLAHCPCSLWTRDWSWSPSQSEKWVALDTLMLLQAVGSHHKALHAQSPATGAPPRAVQAAARSDQWQRPSCGHSHQLSALRPGSAEGRSGCAGPAGKRCSSAQVHFHLNVCPRARVCLPCHDVNMLESHPFW